MPKPQLTRNLTPGMSGADVQELQKFLTSQGYAIPDGPTGYYGDQTKAAVTQWQKANNVQPKDASEYGYFGPLSRQALAGSASSSTVTDQQSSGDPDLDGILGDPTLTPDQKTALQSVYGAVSSNDQNYADRVKSAIAAATQYSDPFFKAQTRLVTDALERSFKAADGDFGFQSSQLTNALGDLRSNIEAAKTSLSLDEQQQLRALERRYTTNLADTHNTLASRGLTSSSIRSRSDELLNDEYQDMRQTTRRSLTERTAAYDRQLSSADRNTSLELARIQDLASRGKITALRSAEGQVGSQALRNLGYGNTLENIPGSLPRAQAQDALSFASGSGIIF